MTTTSDFTDDELDLARMIGGAAFEVENDPDHPGYFSIFATRGGLSSEVAGKIGERAVADFLCSTLRQGYQFPYLGR